MQPHACESRNDGRRRFDGEKSRCFEESRRSGPYLLTRRSKNVGSNNKKCVKPSKQHGKKQHSTCCKAQGWGGQPSCADALQTRAKCTQIQRSPPSRSVKGQPAAALDELSLARHVRSTPHQLPCSSSPLKKSASLAPHIGRSLIRLAPHLSHPTRLPPDVKIRY